jgi:hypothetical protein
MMPNINWDLAIQRPAHLQHPFTANSFQLLHHLTSNVQQLDWPLNEQRLSSLLNLMIHQRNLFDETSLLLLMEIEQRRQRQVARLPLSLTYPQQNAMHSHQPRSAFIAASAASASNQPIINTLANILHAQGQSDGQHQTNEECADLSMS